MDFRQSWINRLVSQDPRDTLRVLADSVEKHGVSEANPIEVSLSLSSNTIISGRLARFGSDQHGEYLLLADEDKTDPMLTIIRLNDVIAVQFKRPSALVDILSDPSPARKGSPPTVLQLKRELEALQNTFKTAGVSLAIEVRWDSFGESADARYAILELTLELSRLIPQIASHTLGASGLKTVEKLVIGHESDKRLDCVRKGNSIELAMDLQRPFPQSWKDTLKTQLESVL